MEWFVAVLAVAALGVAAVAAAGGMGQMGEPVLDTYRQDLPERPLTAEDLEHVRFGITLRGYAMGQVDDLLDRLQREIAERDQRIAELTTVLPDTADTPDTPDTPDTAEPRDSAEFEATEPAVWVRSSPQDVEPEPIRLPS